MIPGNSHNLTNSGNSMQDILEDTRKQCYASGYDICVFWQRES